MGGWPRSLAGTVELDAGGRPAIVAACHEKYAPVVQDDSGSAGELVATCWVDAIVARLPKVARKEGLAINEQGVLIFEGLPHQPLLVKSIIYPKAPPHYNRPFLT